MRSIDELSEMLARELTAHLDVIKNIDGRLMYYNQVLGKTSPLLAALLGEILTEKYN